MICSCIPLSVQTSDACAKSKIFMTPQSFLAVLALLIPSLAAAADESVLTLAIRFHITQGAMMTVKDQPMEVWVKPGDLTGPVLTELNRIWKPV